MLSEICVDYDSKITVGIRTTQCVDMPVLGGVRYAGVARLCVLKGLGLDG